MSSNVIELNHVSKLFFKQEQRTVKELLPALFRGQKAAHTFWALKDVSFDVLQGETLGIIGKNGSGKSTLLKLMAGVTNPTEGTIKVTGRVAPMIELGAGFHPELSGRENVYLNGVILGMTHQQVADIFDQIVEFAEIAEFIDQPIKHYSSGMYLRLAFAVAIHIQADIILLDEILAVGDQSFQEKCVARMNQLRHDQKKTIALVSHNTKLIQDFCDKTLWLDRGTIKAFGPTAEVIKKYSE